MRGRIAAGRPSKVELRLPKPEFRLQTYDSVHPDRKSSKSDQFGQVSRVEIPELPKPEFRLRNYESVQPDRKSSESDQIG